MPIRRFEAARLPSVAGYLPTFVAAMAWLAKILETLIARPACGYLERQEPTAEPTALAVLALAGHGLLKVAQPGADYLLALQRADGAVPVRGGEDSPSWTTSLAVLAWRAVGAAADSPEVLKAVAWIESQHGKSLPRHPDMGHNTEIDGWPWAAGTHSWLEPTAFHLLALKAAQRRDSRRARDAALLLIDRQLPQGGCNYGNTFVLGQELRPHVQPSGIALAALAGEGDHSGRLDRSIGWVRKAISSQTTACSLSWALLGLAAHGVELPESEHWLGCARERVEAHDRSPHKRALIALAALGKKAPLWFH